MFDCFCFFLLFLIKKTLHTYQHIYYNNIFENPFVERFFYSFGIFNAIKMGSYHFKQKH